MQTGGRAQLLKISRRSPMSCSKTPRADKFAPRTRRAARRRESTVHHVALHADLPGAWVLSAAGRPKHRSPQVFTFLKDESSQGLARLLFVIKSVPSPHQWQDTRAHEGLRRPRDRPPKPPAHDRRARPEDDEDSDSFARARTRVREPSIRRDRERRGGRARAPCIRGARGVPDGSRVSRSRRS
jgi:hypothetical protein